MPGQEPAWSLSGTRYSIVLLALAFLLSITTATTAQTDSQPGVALLNGAPYAVRILDTRDGETYISYVGWDSSYDEWVSNDLVSEAPETYSIGDRVFSIWSGNGSPYWAQIIAIDGGQYEVRYDDDSSTEWREWDQLFPVTIGQASVFTERIEDDPNFTRGEGPFEAGDIVGAYWDPDPWWYDAEVLERRADGAYRVRYLDELIEEWLPPHKVMSAADPPVEREYDRAALPYYEDRVSVTVHNRNFERRVVVFFDGARQQTDSTLTVPLPRGTRIYRYNPDRSDRLGQLVFEVD